MKINSSGGAALPRGLDFGRHRSATVPILVGQSCRYAPFSPSASAAQLTESGRGNRKVRTSLRSFWRKFGRRSSAALPLLAALILFFAVGATAETTNTLSDAEVRGCNLAQQLLEQSPATNFNQNGILKVRNNEGKTTNTSVSFQTRIILGDWQTTYEAGPTADAASTAILQITHKNGQPNLYFFSKDEKGLPKYSNLLMTPLHGNGTMIPFAGSDFWIADLGLEFFHWPQQKVLKKEVKRSRGCTVLESTNPNPATNGYARVVSWIDSESGGIVQAEAYDFKNKLLKEFAPKAFKKVNGQWELQEMEIRNVQTGSRTRLEFDLKK